jgi:hypothetical protein
VAVTVKLMGGLGNQLFGYFAGLYVANKLKTNLVLDVYQQKHNHHQGSSISDFHLEGQLIKPGGVGEFAFSSLGLFPPQFETAKQKIKKFLKVHVSQQVGFDEALSRLTDPITLRGYFQTYRYFLSPQISPSQRVLSLQNPSRWFLELEKAAIATKPIVIHVRRGDYTSSLNTPQGVLSKDYYLAGLETISKGQRSVAEVWVFSDSLDEVRGEFGTGGQSFRYIETPINATAAETMTIMSLASGIVISNSTFSYWAAMLGQVPEVVSPKKWFRLADDPEDLCPPNWQKSESLWR